MIAVDTNVLIYAHREELPKHQEAKRAVIELAEGSIAWAIPVFCIGEFVRVITHTKLFDPPHSIDEAIAAVTHVLASPSVRVLVPGSTYIDLFLHAIAEGRAMGNLAFDAQIVALCRESGVDALLTEDRDFRRFSGLTIKTL